MRLILALRGDEVKRDGLHFCFKRRMVICALVDLSARNPILCMGIILWIVFGAIVGWLASLITNTREGIVIDIIVGVVGAVLGGWIMSMFGNTGVSGFNLYSFVVALIGAVVLLFIVKAVRRTV